MQLNEILQRDQQQSLIMMRPEDLQSFAESVAKQVLASKPQQELKEEKNEKPLSQTEAAQFLGKSRQTLIAWRKAGKIKAYKLGGRVYFKGSELLEALEILGI